MFDKCYIRMMPFFRDLFYPTGLNHFLSGPQSGPAELLFAPPPNYMNLHCVWPDRLNQMEILLNGGN